jgi:dTDP-glucose 4,6-dehydratase
MKYTNIVITGGAGFIGSNFVRYIIKKYPEVKITIVDKLTYASTIDTIKDLLENENIIFKKADITDYKNIEKIIKNKDLIVNFAAGSHNDNSLENPHSFLMSNVVGTYNLLELARKHNIRYHHISTDEVYGDIELESTEQFNENSQYKPSSPYSATKAASDMLVKGWIRSFNLKATISNCSNNYGPYQHPEKFIPRQITNILNNKKPILYGNGLNVRDWIHVEDHSQAVDLIIDNGRIDETYLIGVNNEINNITVLKQILKEMNKDEDYFDFVEDRKGHDLKYSINPTKLNKELNFKPKHTDFNKGLKETINWYKENINWVNKLDNKKR